MMNTIVASSHKRDEREQQSTTDVSGHRLLTRGLDGSAAGEDHGRAIGAPRGDGQTLEAVEKNIWPRPLE